MVNREIKRFVGWRIMLSVLWVHEPRRLWKVEEIHGKHCCWCGVRLNLLPNEQHVHPDAVPSHLSWKVLANSFHNPESQDASMNDG